METRSLGPVLKASSVGIIFGVFSCGILCNLAENTGYRVYRQDGPSAMSGALFLA